MNNEDEKTCLLVLNERSPTSCGSRFGQRNGPVEMGMAEVRIPKQPFLERSDRGIALLRTLRQKVYTSRK